jgi:hypothetical protein
MQTLVRIDESSHFERLESAFLVELFGGWPDGDAAR